MHRKARSFHLPQLHLWRGRRKYVVTFLGVMLAALTGVASAQWFNIPNGHGNAYGRAKNAQQGLAVTLTDLSANGSIVSIGPSESGNLYAAVHNPNTVAVTLTSLTPDTGAKITSIDNPSCVADPSTYSVTPWTGSLVIPASGDTAFGSVLLPLTTTASFPSCLAGTNFTLAVTAIANS
jgi:hypothetical protein